MLLPIVEGLACIVIPDATGYCVGIDGSVYSRVINTKRGQGKGRGCSSGLGDEWKKLAPNADAHGYRRIRLAGPGCSGKGVKVHLLVLRLFRGPAPEGMQARHLDGNKDNNRLDNLEWGTPKENNQDKIRHGTVPAGENHGLAKLTWKGVREIRELYRTGTSISALSRRFRVYRNAIRQVVLGKTWKEPA